MTEPYVAELVQPRTALKMPQPSLVAPLGVQHYFDDELDNYTNVEGLL